MTRSDVLRPRGGPNRGGLKRRGLLGAGLGLSAAALLAGCGAPGGTGEKSRQAPVEVPAEFRGRTPVLFWAPFTGVNLKALQDRIDAFNQSQDDVVVVAESQGSYKTLNQKFIAAIQSGAVPDIVAFPELQWIQFYFANAFVELDRYFDDQWNLGVYLDNYVNEGVAAGKTFLVPFARSTPLFYFNRDRYREVGLPETGPTTWDQLAEFGQELGTVQVNGRPLRAHAFGADDSWYMQAQIWAWGGTISRDFDVTVDEQPVIDWLEWQRAFIHDQKLAYLAKSAMTDLTTGIVAGCHGSTASLAGATKTAKFDVGVAFMLNQRAEQMKVPTGGAGLSIVRGSSQERQDGAAAFFRFMADPEQAAMWHRDTGYVPIVKAAAETSIVKELVATNPNYGVALAQLERAHTADRSNWFQSSIDVLQTEVSLVYGDNADPRQVLTKAAGKMQRILDDNRSDIEEIL